MEWLEKEYLRRQGDRPAHWFDADTMRFFSSRVLGAEIHRQKGTARIVFVTSEQNDSPYTDHPRRYSVRVMDHRGDIETVGPFCEWSRSKARQVARDLAARKPYPGHDLAGRRVEA